MNVQIHPTRKRLTIGAMVERLGVSRATIKRWYRFGTLPKPHYIGQNRVWWEDEIEEWEACNMSSEAAPRNGSWTSSGDAV